MPMVRRWTLLVCAVLGTSCGGLTPAGPTTPDTPVPSDRSGPLSALSGTWTGTLTATPLGNCPTTSPQRLIATTWTVTDAGTVLLTDGTPFIRLFGTIDADWRVQARRDAFVTCPGTATGRVFTATYTGAITGSPGRYRAELEAVEDLCPPDCVFKMTYVLTKS